MMIQSGSTCIIGLGGWRRRKVVPRCLNHSFAARQRAGPKARLSCPRRCPGWLGAAHSAWRHRLSRSRCPRCSYDRPYASRSARPRCCRPAWQRWTPPQAREVARHNRPASKRKQRKQRSSQLVLLWVHCSSAHVMMLSYRYSAAKSISLRPYSVTAATSTTPAATSTATAASAAASASTARLGSLTESRIGCAHEDRRARDRESERHFVIQRRAR
jgi:hypothetical protein